MIGGHAEAKFLNFNFDTAALVATFCFAIFAEGNSVNLYVSGLDFPAEPIATYCSDPLQPRGNRPTR